MKKRNAIIKVVGFFVMLVLINLLSYYFFFRLDFTADKSFTLSKATKDILKNIKEKVSVHVYFSEDLPTQLIKSKIDFKNLLVEYKNLSVGKVSFDFINPNENEAQEKLAQAEGIKPIMVNVSERDQVKQLRAYMGATLQVNDKKEVIPVIQPGESAEYPLTTAIKKLTTTEKIKVAFLNGHGEYPGSALRQVTDQISVSDSVEEYSINDTAEIPQDYKALMIIDPKDSIPTAHLAKIDNYLNQGGSILLAYSNVYGQLSEGMVQVVPEIGIRNWLAKKGILLGNQLLIDFQCRKVAVQEPLGSYAIARQLKYPYFPVIKKFADHPVTEGIEAVFFPFLSSISVTGKDPALTITPLAWSSKRSGFVGTPIKIDFNKEWSAKDFNTGPQIVGVAVEGPIGGAGKSKMVFFPNGKFAVNTEPGQEELNSDNVNLVSNAIDWLSDNTGLIELRTKTITSRPLDPVEDSTKEMIKYLNVFLPIVIILFVGLARRYRNLKKRRKLIEVTY